MTVIVMSVSNFNEAIKLKFMMGKQLPQCFSYTLFLLIQEDFPNLRSYSDSVFGEIGDETND